MKKKLINKEKKEIEYPDAPSGFVTFYNYKEPFMDFEYEGSGFGYQGVLLFDGVSNKIQCHFCGTWHKVLGNHIHREHNMLARDYKKLTGLRQTTALVNEEVRAKMIATGQKRFLNLKPGGKKSQAVKDKIRATLQQNPMESKNERGDGGTCPDQLIKRLIQESDRLGRCPTTKELSFYPTLMKTYGTYERACELAGLVPLKTGQTLSRYRRYSKENVGRMVNEYYIKYNSFPKTRREFTAELVSNTAWLTYKKNKKEINKKILSTIGKYQKTGVIVNYSKEELLNFLKLFIETNDRLPSVSDCKRGLLPHASRYYYHFGSLKKALTKLNNLI